MQGILTHRSSPDDTVAQHYVRAHHEAILDILLKMANHVNFFAKREALKLLNTLLRDPGLKEILGVFISSVVPSSPSSHSPI